MFWVWKSDHFEFLNTLPKEVTVLFSLLLRSKKIFKCAAILLLTFKLDIKGDKKKFKKIFKRDKKIL
jgi:hypothetical protein